MRTLQCGLAVTFMSLSLPSASHGGDGDAKALVTKAIKAAGGDAKVALLKAGTCKAKANVQDGNQQIAATLDVTWQGWDQYRVTVALEAGGQAKNVVIVINGDKAWAKDTDRNKIEEAPKEIVRVLTGMLSALRMPQMLPALLDKEVKLSPLGEMKVDDRDAVGVTVARKDRSDVSLYFDKETGLPAKSEVRLTGPDGMEKTFTFLYRDYKETAGARQPMRIVMRVDNSDAVMELSALKAEGKVDGGLFAAPE